MSDPSLAGTGYGDMPDAGSAPGGTNGNADENFRKQQEQAARDKAAADAKAAAAEADRARNAHFQYGGWAGGANEAASRYAGIGAAAQGRAGESLALGAVNDDRNANAQARGQSYSMAQLLQDRANGKMPLISGMRADLDTSHALADQSSIAASARGPAALALAQQNQANNSASAISNISNNAQINGAQEQLNNTMAAGQAFNTIRGGDQSLMGADTSVSVAQAQINAAQRAENDRMQLGMTGAETDVQKAQLGAQGNQVGIAAGQANAQAARDQAAGFHSDDRLDKYLGIGAGVAGTVGGTLLLSALGGGGGGKAGAEGGVSGGGTATGTSAGAGSGGTATDGSYNAGASLSGDPGASSSDSGDPYPPGRADGGPVEAGKPYLVGERGPELIVPPRDGHVLTAEQTRAAAPASRADAFLEKIHPLSYTYKDAANEPRSQPTGGRYLGISAQDLESVPDIGKQMVSEGPNGKRIEMGPTLSAALAGMARLHERVKELEGGGKDGGHITSDMAAKTDVSTEGATPYVDPRAKAWDEGHNAALDKVQQMRMMSPEQLRQLGDNGNRLANAVRGAKADAYDEARGISQHIMQPRPERQLASFSRGDDEDMSRSHPLAQRFSDAAMTGAARGGIEGGR